MRYRVLNGGCSVAAATGLVAASLVAGVASASVEVRGSIEGLPDGASAEVSLVSAPPLYDLLAAVLADDPSGLYPVQATVQAQDGRFAFEVAELGVRWVRVRRGGSASEALLLVGPETDMLLPPIEAARTASCTLKLVTPGSAWVVAGRSLRDLRFSRSWNNVRLFAAAPGHGTVWRELPESVAGMRGDQGLGDVALESEIVLRGRVVDEDGAPVAGATVDLERLSRGRGRSHCARRRLRASRAFLGRGAAEPARTRPEPRARDRRRPVSR